MLVGCVVGKNIIINKFLILYVYKHKTSRSRVPRRIILNMVNKCVTNCTSGYATGEKKPSFLFPEDEELSKKWIDFVNSKNWTPTKYYVLCIDYFHDKFIKHGKSRWKLNLELYPVPTIHPCVNSQSSLLNTSKVPRQSPRKRTLSEPDEFEVFINRY